MTRRHFTKAALLALLVATPAFAHDGPPFPILVDEEISGCLVSVWADPDVGVGTFYVYTDSELDLAIAVEPTDLHVAEAVFAAEEAAPEEPFQLVGEVDFDRRGPWTVTFLADGPAGVEELSLPVDVTPPGLGRVDLLWYLSPFLAVAFLWIKVALARRALS